MTPSMKKAVHWTCTWASSILFLLSSSVHPEFGDTTRGISIICKFLIQRAVKQPSPVIWLCVPASINQSLIPVDLFTISQLSLLLSYRISAYFFSSGKVQTLKTLSLPWDNKNSFDKAKQITQPLCATILFILCNESKEKFL